MALRCSIALAPRQPQVLNGVTEEIGRSSAVILLDHRLPMGNWPRVGDAVVAICEMPETHNAEFPALQCRGTVTEVFVAEDGMPRLEMSVDRIRFNGGSRSSRAATPKANKGGRA